MPFVVNGIGTWYYGKRHIHTHHGTCEFCRRYTNLTSYDTTLFFVVAFVPLIPLGQKRILNQCGVCQKHRLLSRRKWLEAKEKDGAAVLDRLAHDPDDRDAVMAAIGFALTYQDEPLFDDVVERLTGDRTKDSPVQVLLGEGYEYFARWPEAEQAYRNALAVEETEFVREKLAWVLLKQGRPDEARPFLQHIITGRKEESAGMLYLLASGYQAQGMHEEALELMDERDEAFPSLAATKDWKQQRKSSLRYRSSGRKVASPVLAAGRAGYREGGWSARLPYVIAGAVFLGLILLYFGVAIWKGQSRKVYLVNGTGHPYAVTVGGVEYTLRPATPTLVYVPEGDVEVAFTDPKATGEPIRAHIETDFWGRPFVGHTFVINPDRSAVVIEELAFFAAANPPPGPPPQVHFGQAFYDLPGVDYEFQEFPPSIQVKKTEQVKKTRVGLMAGAPEFRFAFMQGLPEPDQLAICRQALAADPADSQVLEWLCHKLPAADAIAFVEPRLGDRPPRVDWHRGYQTLMERAHPEADLRPRYQALAAETNNSPDAVYLLGRINPDPAERDWLYRQAAAASPPSAYAAAGLGFMALSEGRFAEAAEWYEKAIPHLADKTIVEHLYAEALLAAGRYDDLLNRLRRDAPRPGRLQWATGQIVRIHAIRGEIDKAQTQIAMVLATLTPSDQATSGRALRAVLSCASGDEAGYATQTKDVFEPALLGGLFNVAEKQVPGAGEDAVAYHGLLYLAGVKAKNADVSKRHWEALLTALAAGDRDAKEFGDLLAGRQKVTADRPKRLTIEPGTKRVLLAVLAQRQPAKAKELLALAKRLDYQHDGVSLCLAKFVPGWK